MKGKLFEQDSVCCRKIKEMESRLLGNATGPALNSSLPNDTFIMISAIEIELT